MRNVLLLERSEVGVCERPGEGVVVRVVLDWCGERREVGAIGRAIGVVVVRKGCVLVHESPLRAGSPLSQEVRMFEAGSRVGWQSRQKPKR